MCLRCVAISCPGEPRFSGGVVIINSISRGGEDSCGLSYIPLSSDRIGIRFICIRLFGDTAS